MSQDRSGRSQKQLMQDQLLSELSRGLDIQHHDTSLRHEFGGAFDTPEAVTPSSSGAGTVGSSPSPARADHQHAVEVPTFVVPTFLNGWSNYGGGWQTARYFKMGGMVHIEGLVTSGTMGAPFFYLDVGYRPLMLLMFATVATNVFGRLNVMSDGGVHSEPGLGTNSFYNLNCSFYPGA